MDWCYRLRLGLYVSQPKAIHFDVDYTTDSPVLGWYRRSYSCTAVSPPYYYQVGRDFFDFLQGLADGVRDRLVVFVIRYSEVTTTRELYKFLVLFGSQFVYILWVSRRRIKTGPTQTASVFQSGRSRYYQRVYRLFSSKDQRDESENSP